MSAALLKINKSVCHLCVALDRHATVHLGPFAKNIGSWILKSRLASGKLRDKQTNQTVKKKKKKRGEGGNYQAVVCSIARLDKWGFISIENDTCCRMDGWTASTLSPENSVISTCPEINVSSVESVRRRTINK